MYEQLQTKKKKKKKALKNERGHLKTIESQGSIKILRSFLQKSSFMKKKF